MTDTPAEHPAPHGEGPESAQTEATAPHFRSTVPSDLTLTREASHDKPISPPLVAPPAPFAPPKTGAEVEADRLRAHAAADAQRTKMEHTIEAARTQAHAMNDSTHESNATRIEAEADHLMQTAADDADHAKVRANAAATEQHDVLRTTPPVPPQPPAVLQFTSQASGISQTRTVVKPGPDPVAAKPVPIPYAPFPRPVRNSGGSSLSPAAIVALVVFAAGAAVALFVMHGKGLI